MGVGAAPAEVEAPGTALAERPTVVSLELGPKQGRILDAALSGVHRYIAAGGAIRGGKTFAMLAVIFILMRLFPRSRWAVVRSDLPTLRRNTVPSIEKLREMTGGWVGPLNGGTWTYTAANGSQLILFPEGSLHDPDLDRWKGLEVNGFLLEEGNELIPAAFSKAIERAGAWIIPPTLEQKVAGELPPQPPPLIFVTFNPSEEWTDELFHEPHEQGTLRAPYFFQPLTILDNPHLSPEYRASLEALREVDPAGYARFVEGKRGTVVHPNQLIRSDWIAAAREAEVPPGPPRFGGDVARFGGDSSVAAILDGDALRYIEGREGLDTEDVADWFHRLIVEHEVRAEHATIDEVGVGGGPVDKIRRKGVNVRAFSAGGKVVPRDTGRVVGEERTFQPIAGGFDNLWSQAAWEFREKLRTGRFRLPEQMPKQLVRDLLALRFEYLSERKIHVTSGSELRKRPGGWSPDYAVALIMGAFDWPPRPARPAIPPTTSMRTFR